jgi:hypothetical protein
MKLRLGLCLPCYTSWNIRGFSSSCCPMPPSIRAHGLQPRYFHCTIMYTRNIQGATPFSQRPRKIFKVESSTTWQREKGAVMLACASGRSLKGACMYPIFMYVNGSQGGGALYFRTWQKSGYALYSGMEGVENIALQQLVCPSNLPLHD